MSRRVRTAVLLAVAVALVVVRLVAVSNEPRYLPGSNRSKVIVGVADFDRYCAQTYPSAEFHQLSNEADGLVCTDRSSALWAPQVIVPSDVCRYQWQDSDVVDTGRPTERWVCVRSP